MSGVSGDLEMPVKAKRTMTDDNVKCMSDTSK